MENLSSILPFAVNFTVVVLVLFFATKGWLRQFVYQRHERIKDYLSASDKEHVLARERASAAEAALRSLDGELEIAVADEAAAARSLAQELLDRAKEDAARIARDADALVEAQAMDSDEKMKIRFVDLIIDAAGERLGAGFDREVHGQIFERAESRLGAGA